MAIRSTSTNIDIGNATTETGMERYSLLFVEESKALRPARRTLNEREERRPTGSLILY